MSYPPKYTNEGTDIPALPPVNGYAAEHGNTPAMGSAKWAPQCPECGRRMHYEDDRDENGNLTQSPWWECSNCLVSIPMMQPHNDKLTP